MVFCLILYLEIYNSANENVIIDKKAEIVYIG